MEAENLWAEVTCLKGIVLKTLELRNPFTITQVEEDRLAIQQLSSGRERFLGRDVVFQSFFLLKERGEISCRDVAQIAGDKNAAYLATLLAAMPDVAVSHKPIRLIYYGSQLFYLPIQKN